MMTSAIWRVNGMSSQNPLPQLSTTGNTFPPVAARPANQTMTVAMSAKMKASGIHRSVHSVKRIASSETKFARDGLPAALRTMGGSYTGFTGASTGSERAGGGFSANEVGWGF